MRFALIAVLLFASCGKKDVATEAKPTPEAKAPTVAPTNQPVVDGVRTVAIEAGKDGYNPERIPGKPGEKLKLVFTRTIEASCIDQLVTPDGKTIELPFNKPVEVAVTVPNDGEVRFACSMDMFRGVVVADKSKS